MRVVIADDSVLLREGLARVLADGGFEVVAQAGDADELLRDGRRATSPDVAIVDVRMPPTHTDEGARAAVEIRARAARGRRPPPLAVRRGAPRARRSSATARGVRLPAEGPRAEIDDFLDAVRRVGEGGTAIDPEVVAQLLGRQRAGRPARRAHAARARGARADGRGPLEPGDLREALRQPEDRRDARQLDLREARPPPAQDDHRRVLAVLAYLRGGGS